MSRPSLPDDICRYQHAVMDHMEPTLAEWKKALSDEPGTEWTIHHLAGRFESLGNANYQDLHSVLYGRSELDSGDLKAVVYGLVQCLQRLLPKEEVRKLENSISESMEIRNLQRQLRLLMHDTKYLLRRFYPFGQMMHRPDLPPERRSLGSLDFTKEYRIEWVSNATHSIYVLPPGPGRGLNLSVKMGSREKALIPGRPFLIGNHMRVTSLYGLNLRRALVVNTDFPLEKGIQHSRAALMLLLTDTGLHVFDRGSEYPFRIYEQVRSDYNYVDRESSMAYAVQEHKPEAKPIRFEGDVTKRDEESSQSQSQATQERESDLWSDGDESGDTIVKD